jgi:hypothetical protein
MYWFQSRLNDWPKARYWNDGHFTVRMCRAHLHCLQVSFNLYRTTISWKRSKIPIYIYIYIYIHIHLTFPLLTLQNVLSASTLRVPVKPKLGGLQSHPGRPARGQPLIWMSHTFNFEWTFVQSHLFLTPVIRWATLLAAWLWGVVQTEAGNVLRKLRHFLAWES